jgi:hypothetical protein
MTQNSSSPVTSKPYYTIIGALIGAAKALDFTKMGRPALIGVGAINWQCI